MTGIETIADLFAGPGARDYLGEAVTIGEHMRQAGALAEAAEAAAPLVAAALLHDVGHLRSEPRGGLGPPGSGVSPGDRVSPRDSTDARHGTAGAQWLSRWFGPEVTEPVRLHVAAKRYLCATEPGYFALLSAESVRTLALQGGPMTPEQAAAFGALPYARDAVAVRRWDDEAKDPSVTPPEFGHFEALLRALLKRGPLSS
jgi:gamma-butyrobetaine dioxygenase